MPFGEYSDFDDCLAKNSDKDNPSAYCGYIKNQVEEALKQKEATEAVIKATEQAPEQVASLTTPDAGDIPTEEPKDLTSPTGSSKESENPNASGDGELGQTTSPQDQAEDKTANPRDQAEPPNVGHQTTTEVSPDSDIIKEDKYGKLNGDTYAKNEQDEKDKKRDEHQGLEYNGETYSKVKALEYDDEIYVQKDDKEEASEDDLEYEDDVYRKATEDDLELDDDIYVKDNEQAPIGDDVDATISSPLEIAPDLNPIGESVIIKENGKYKKYNIFQAKEQEEDSINPPAEVKDIPKVEQPQEDVSVNPEEPNVEPVEQKEPSEDITAVEKIIIKENGKLKFKSVFTEVKKKA